jgi:type IV pilus assembly protein PilW
MWSPDAMRAPLRHAQRGYTLIELSVSIIIALFLMAGLLTLVMHTRTASTTQAQMQQLQENERIAMTIMANVIQQAGYFPDPTTYTNTSLGGETDGGLGAGGSGSVTYGVGQALSGVTGAAVPGDVVGARFVAPIADASAVVSNDIITCGGTTNTDTALPHQYTNIFQIATVSGVPYLQCLLIKDGNSSNITTVNLVPGLYDMTILYGVATGTDNNVTQFLSAATVQSTNNWANVTAVKVRLYFQLPNYGFSGGQVNSGATSSAVTNGTQYVERVISIMSRTGVNT